MVEVRDRAGTMWIEMSIDKRVHGEGVLPKKGQANTGTGAGQANAAAFQSPQLLGVP